LKRSYLIEIISFRPGAYLSSDRLYIACTLRVCLDVHSETAFKLDEDS